MFGSLQVVTILWVFGILFSTSCVPFWAYNVGISTYHLTIGLKSVSDCEHYHSSKRLKLQTCNRSCKWVSSEILLVRAEHSSWAINNCAGEVTKTGVSSKLLAEILRNNMRHRQWWSFSHKHKLVINFIMVSTCPSCTKAGLYCRQVKVPHV